MYDFWAVFELVALKSSKVPVFVMQIQRAPMATQWDVLDFASKSFKPWHILFFDMDASKHYATSNLIITIHGNIIDEKIMHSLASTVMCCFVIVESSLWDASIVRRHWRWQHWLLRNTQNLICFMVNNETDRFTTRVITPTNNLAL